MIADDDADVCSLLERVLEPLGLVIVVNDAEAALATLASEPPFDVIISDFMLPGITGLEFVERLRAEPLTEKTPVIMISGHGAAVVHDRARAAGVHAFLDKPFTLAALREAVQAVIGPAEVFAV